jgi:hypothetical protein
MGCWGVGAVAADEGNLGKPGEPETESTVPPGGASMDLGRTGAAADEVAGAPEDPMGRGPL